MSTPVQLVLAVGEPADPRPGGPALVSLADAGVIAAAAEAAGVTAIRLAHAGSRTLDPTVVAAYLAGLHGGLGYVTELPTTGNAPYNAARRILSLDRATGGRVGVALRTGRGDEVSEATAPDPGATDPVRRWTEYARVLIRLWESFPRAALIGDQAAGLVVDDALIRPISHEGAFYRVAGPLDGPSSVQGRPVLVADLGDLDVAAVAPAADVVVAGRDRAAGADAALTRAWGLTGRARTEVVLLGRVELAAGEFTGPAALASELLAWADQDRLDGFELVPSGDTASVLAVLREVVPRLVDVGVRTSPPTLRTALGLRAAAGVPA